jgi:lysozyme family protein
MSANTPSQGELVRAIGLLVKRRGNTTDATEKAVINQALDKLNGNLQDLDQADLLQAVQILASASDELENVVGAARLGPFDTYLADIENVITGLQGQQGQIHSSQKLPSADVRAVKALDPALIDAAKPNVAPKPPNVATIYADLKSEYETYYALCTANRQRSANVEYCISRIEKFKQVYHDVGSDLNIPWYFIGIIHGMECGFNFGAHLHNGDPLTARTVNVPANRPANGKPPFTWRDSARDAMIFDGYTHETEWSIPRMLYLFEKYNGFGYRKLGIPSPYVWSFSNLYIKGKFLSDHHFDPNAVSAQCGAGVILKDLQARGAF